MVYIKDVYFLIFKNIFKYFFIYNFLNFISLFNLKVFNWKYFLFKLYELNLKIYCLNNLNKLNLNVCKS